MPMMNEQSLRTFVDLWAQMTPEQRAEALRRQCEAFGLNIQQFAYLMAKPREPIERHTLDIRVDGEYVYTRKRTRPNEG